MRALTRRAFLGRLAAVLAVARVAPTLPSLGLRLPPTPGIALRFIRGYDATRAEVTRLDVLYGMATVRPECAARIEG